MEQRREQDGEEHEAEAERCTRFDDGVCECARCEARKVAAAEQQQRWKEEAAAYHKAEQAKKAAADALEAEVAALLSSSPQSLAALPEPTQEQLQLAESYI